MEEGGKEGREGGSLSRKILETVVQLFDIMARLRSCFTDAPAETLTPQSCARVYILSHHAMMSLVPNIQSKNGNFYIVSNLCSYIYILPILGVHFCLYQS